MLTREQAAEYGYGSSAPQTWMALAVHSSLAAVGLTAAVATALAARGIACNVVAGYSHRS